MTNPKVEAKQTKYFSQEIIDGVSHFLTILEEEVGDINVKIEVKTNDYIFHEYTKDPTQDISFQEGGLYDKDYYYVISRKEVMGTETLESKFETGDFFHAKDYLDSVAKWDY